jgi:hypothetical protein
MHPYASQALVATRVTEMYRQAEIARLALEVKRARRRGRRWARIQPGHIAQPARGSARAGLPAV